MAMNFKELPEYLEAVNKMSEEIANGADTERQQELFAEAFSTLGKEIESKNEAELARLVEQRLAHKDMTAEDRKSVV